MPALLRPCSQIVQMKYFLAARQLPHFWLGRSFSVTVAARIVSPQQFRGAHTNGVGVPALASIVDNANSSVHCPAKVLNRNDEGRTPRLSPKKVSIYKTWSHQTTTTITSITAHWSTMPMRSGETWTTLETKGERFRVGCEMGCTGSRQKRQH